MGREGTHSSTDRVNKKKVGGEGAEGVPESSQKECETGRPTMTS